MNNYEKEYEERFDRYIRTVIKKTFLKYLQNEKKLTERLYFCDYEINNFIGDEDLLYVEKITPSNLERAFENKVLFNATKPLTDKEKLAVFLYVILERKPTEIQKIMGYKDRTTINKLIYRAIDKIKRNIEQMEDNYND